MNFTRPTTALPVLAPLLLVPTILCACNEDTGNTWTEVWSDEFEGSAGQLPSAANWTFDIGTDWGNAQLEYDTDRPENVSLEFLLVHNRVALVHAVAGPPVTHPVLRAGQDALRANPREIGGALPALAAAIPRPLDTLAHALRAHHTPTLQPPHDPARIPAHHPRILRIALVRPPPAWIPRHRQRGRKGPIHPRRPHLARRDPPDPLDQVGVAHGAQPDVVREDRRAQHIGISVNRVHAIEERDRQVVVVLLHRRGPVGVVHGHPVGRAVVPRARAAAAEHRADVVPLHLGGADVNSFRLRHLADLLVHGHPREEFPHSLPDVGGFSGHSRPGACETVHKPPPVRGSRSEAHGFTVPRYNPTCRYVRTSHSRPFSLPRLGLHAILPNSSALIAGQ